MYVSCIVEYNLSILSIVKYPFAPQKCFYSINWFSKISFQLKTFWCITNSCTINLQFLDVCNRNRSIQIKKNSKWKTKCFELWQYEKHIHINKFDFVKYEIQESLNEVRRMRCINAREKWMEQHRMIKCA